MAENRREDSCGIHCASRASLIPIGVASFGEALKALDDTENSLSHISKILSPLAESVGMVLLQVEACRTPSLRIERQTQPQEIDAAVR